MIPSSLPIMSLYIVYFTVIMLTLILAGLFFLGKCPSQYKKVALLWVIIGLAQIVLAGLIFYPYNIFVFPSITAFGLFTLTCGIIITTFSIMRTQSPRIFSIGILLIGILELVAFFDFYFKFPDLSRWNDTIDATPYIAFLVASIVTLGCGILALWKPEFSRPKKDG